MSKYLGADWVERQEFVPEMSLLGKAAADLLGDVFEGIYHLGDRTLAKVQWSHPEIIQITIGRYLSSVDDNLLTRFVVLAHDRAMRVSMKGIGNGYLRLTISQRQREGDFYSRCPTLEDHVVLLRNHYGEPTP